MPYQVMTLAMIGVMMPASSMGSIVSKKPSGERDIVGAKDTVMLSKNCQTPTTIAAVKPAPIMRLKLKEPLFSEPAM